MKQEVVDGLEFYDDEDPTKKVIFNQYSFCEILKWTMVKYANFSYSEASKMIDDSWWINPPTSYLSVALTTHEYEYHWAMLMAYGEQYWNKGLAPYPPDDSYFEWLDHLIKEKGLNDSYQYLDIEK